MHYDAQNRNRTQYLSRLAAFCVTLGLAGCWLAVSTVSIASAAPIESTASTTSAVSSASTATVKDLSGAVGQATDPWRKSIALIMEGDFVEAEEIVENVKTQSPLTEKLQSWLSEYKSVQEERRKSDQEEFDRYVTYAKQRIERKEWNQALDWVWLAADVAEDRDAYLISDWVQQLVNDSLDAAKKARSEQQWRKAWDIYGRLSSLFEQEPRYQQLEREVRTHLRLEAMFKEGSNWMERLEKIRWAHAKRALEYIDEYYVSPVDFKDLTTEGLSELLLLAESPSAQKVLEGLQDEHDRFDFVVRLKERLAQVESAPSLTRRDCIGHFRRVVQEINPQTVRLPEELVVSELMEGALQPLDEFTAVIWPKEVEEFEKHTRGDFIGVGIQIIKNRDGGIEVVTPLDDTPAYRAGIQAGDIIAGVDGEPLGDISLNKVVETITGPKDTMVTLTIRREGKEIEFPLLRELVKIQSVKGVKRDSEFGETWDHWLDKEGGIAYIRVTNFQRNTVEDVENRLHDLRGQGMKGLVLDLRGNPGGLLDSAYRMSSLFLEDSDGVVSTKGRIREENHEFEAQGDGLFSDLPLVVLVDESSASASEIVSGAIRDNHCGLVIGARTFGKFSVQNLIPLGYSQAKLKLTTASYYLPSGVSLHRKPTSTKWGVEPNIPIRLTRWEKINLWTMRREADLLGPPKVDNKEGDSNNAVMNDNENEDTSAPENGKSASSGEKGDKSDAQSGDESDAKAGDDKALDDQTVEEKDGEKVADAQKDKENDLPPLEQPDENNRSKRDPQLETALLVIRAKVLAEQYPTLAAVAKASETETTTVQP